MLTAKKKISARQAAPTSRTTDFFTTAQFWITENPKILGGVVLGIAAIIIVAYLYSSGRAADDLAANRELRKVQELYQQQQYDIAINGDPAQGIIGLEEIVDKYGSTPTGEIAKLYLGNAYLFTDELDKAMATFKDASPGTEMLRASVFAGQAAVYEARGEYEEAASHFEKAATNFENELLTAERYLMAGMNYGEAGKMDKAKKMLEKVKESKNTRFHPNADRLLAKYQLTEE